MAIGGGFHSELLYGNVIKVNMAAGDRIHKELLHHNYRIHDELLHYGELLHHDDRIHGGCIHGDQIHGGRSMAVASTAVGREAAADDGEHAAGIRARAWPLG